MTLLKNKPLLVRIIGLLAVVIVILNLYLLYQINKSEIAKVPIKVMPANNTILRNAEVNENSYDKIHFLLLLDGTIDDLELSGGKIVVDIPVSDRENEIAEALTQMNKSSAKELKDNDDLLKSEDVEFLSASSTDVKKAVNYYSIRGAFKDRVMTRFDIISITTGGLPVIATEGVETIRVSLINFKGYDDRTIHIPIKKTNIFELDGQVGVGTLHPSTKFHVNGRISDSSGVVMPKGGIIQWAEPNLPHGWVWYNSKDGDTSSVSPFNNGQRTHYIKKL